MGEWTDVTLGDVLTLQRGFDLPQRKRRPGQYPVVSSAGFTGFHDEFKVGPPGVVIGRYGSLGTVHWVQEPFWPLNTALWVKDFKGNDPRFISYLLETVAVDGSAAAAVPGVNRNHLHKQRVRVPPVRLQRRIVALLSTLDELIAINERRIELLEDLARSLYREWFVHRRYPGYDHSPFVDSVLGPLPSGWTSHSFADLAAFLNGFAFKPSDHRESGIPIVKIKELKQGVTHATPRCEEAEIDSKYIISPGDLLFSWSADLGVYLWSGERGALNQHLFKVTPDKPKMAYFLFHALKEALPAFRNRAQGTTMRHIKRSALREVKTVVPHEELLTLFDVQAGSLHRGSMTIGALSELLGRLRNLLLPRLVTGQLDISDVDLGALLPPDPE